MQPEDSAASLDRELAARLAARDGERASEGSSDPGELNAGLPPEAAARLRGALEGLARLHARWPGQPQPEDAPRPFGKFLIERELGRGGHGIVFLAVDPALKRRVALKIPRPELLDEPDWRRRFLREAHALARLDHPGIVAILEVGEVDGVCYIASSYCDGPDLTAWCKARETPLRPRAAARVAGLIAEAVGHAHTHGVVHRDLKPRNILMQTVECFAGPDDLGAHPRVTDFGLAKFIEADAELTRTGVVLGTPRYMAPEQREARHDLVGPPTDVYAIGVILNQMLIGRQIVLENGSDGASPARAGSTGILPVGSADTGWKPVPRGAAPARPVPRALRAIVAKSLEPEPSRRYADASELAADLDRFRNGGPVHAARSSPRAILAHAGRRPAVAMTALAMAFLMTAVYLLSRRTSGRLDSPQAITPAPSPARQLTDQMDQRRRYAADLQLVAGLAPSDLEGSTYKLAMTRAVLDRHRPHGPEGDLRTWEWYYFQLMLHGERTTLSGHHGAVYHLEYSRDGARLASSGEDGARVWNAASGAPLRGLREHSGCVNWVAFSPDGTKLATASDDRTVGLWSAADGRGLLPPLIHQHKVVVVLFTSDGRRLIACDRGGIVTTWDGTTGAAIRSVKVSDEPLEGMDLSPDGSILATAASHGVTLWDYPAMKRPASRVPSDNFPHRFDCVAFSHDGRRFATSGGAQAQQVRVWDTQTGRLVRSFTHHAEERVLTVAFSPDDHLLLSMGSDEAARVWDLARGECVGILAGHSAWVWCGGFAPDGKSIATGGGDGTIKLWSIPHRGAETRCEQPSLPTLALTYSPDGRSLYTATSSGPLIPWELVTARNHSVLPFRPTERPIDAAFAPGAALVAVADGDGGLSIGSPLRGRPDFTRPRATRARPCLTFADDGKTLAYVDKGGRVVRLDVTERDPRPAPVRSQPSAPSSLAFTLDGRLLAGDAEGRLRDCDGGPGNPGEPDHQGRITCLAISPDGALCATGGEDASIVLRDSKTLHPRARLSGPKQAIDALAFTPDGKTLVSAADRVQLWNVATAQPTLALVEGLERVDPPGRLATSADGTSVCAIVHRQNVYRVLIWRTARTGAE